MTTIPLAEAQADLSQLIDEVVLTHERTEITRDGRPVAVLLSAQDFDSLQETLDVLADAELIAEVRESLAELAAADVLTTEELLATLPENIRDN